MIFKPSYEAYFCSFIWEASAPRLIKHKLTFPDHGSKIQFSWHKEPRYWWTCSSRILWKQWHVRFLTFFANINAHRLTDQNFNICMICLSYDPTNSIVIPSAWLDPARDLSQLEDVSTVALTFHNVILIFISPQVSGLILILVNSILQLLLIILLVYPIFFLLATHFLYGGGGQTMLYLWDMLRIVKKC